MGVQAALYAKKKSVIFIWQQRHRALRTKNGSNANTIIVFTPKYRRKVIYNNQYRNSLRESH